MKAGRRNAQLLQNFAQGKGIADHGLGQPPQPPLMLPPRAAAAAHGSHNARQPQQLSPDPAPDIGQRGPRQDNVRP